MAEIWFFRPVGIAGDLVTLWTGGQYSHVGVAHEIAGIPVFSDATGVYGVACRARESQERPDVAIPFDIGDLWITARIATYYGRPYSWRDILGFMIGGSHDKKGLICTTLVIDVLSEALALGVKVPGGVAVAGLSRTKTTPDQLLATLMKTQ